MEQDLLRLKEQAANTEKMSELVEVKRSQMNELIELKKAQILALEQIHGTEFF